MGTNEQTDNTELLCDDTSYMKHLEAEVKRLQDWVDDLQSGMYINCVYCGHRYGPDSEIPATMADVLKEHIEQCPKHPMSKLKAIVKMVPTCLCRNREPLSPHNDRCKEYRQMLDEIGELGVGG